MRRCSTEKTLRFHGSVHEQVQEQHPTVRDCLQRRRRCLPHQSEDLVMMCPVGRARGLRGQQHRWARGLMGQRHGGGEGGGEDIDGENHCEGSRSEQQNDENHHAGEGGSNGGKGMQQSAAAGVRLPTATAANHFKKAATVSMMISFICSCRNQK